MYKNIVILFKKILKFVVVLQRWSNDNLTDSKSFKSQIKITGNIPADGNNKIVEVPVPLKYFTNF